MFTNSDVPTFRGLEGLNRLLHRPSSSGSPHRRGTPGAAHA
jgi:hypothetical protein